jgi:hypothetical protein
MSDTSCLVTSSAPISLQPDRFCPAQRGEKSPLPSDSAWRRSGARASPAKGYAGGTTGATPVDNRDERVRQEGTAGTATHVLRRREYRVERSPARGAIGPRSRIKRFTRPRAGRPVSRFVTAVCDAVPGEGREGPEEKEALAGDDTEETEEL